MEKNNEKLIHEYRKFDHNTNVSLLKKNFKKHYQYFRLILE